MLMLRVIRRPWAGRNSTFIMISYNQFCVHVYCVLYPITGYVYICTDLSHGELLIMKVACQLHTLQQSVNTFNKIPKFRQFYLVVQKF